ADHFVTGAATDDGQQVLVVVPAAAAGVRVGPPLELCALQGSLTAEVRCEAVRLPRRWLLAGPAPQAVGGARGPGGLDSSALALGLAEAAAAFLGSEGRAR